MGFWDDLTGKTGADAARAAAADTYAKQNKAIGGIKDYGNTYANDFNNLSQAYNTNGTLTRLINDPSSVSSLPGYQFAQDQGIQAIDHSAASRGMLNSGRTEKDLMRFSTGLADQTYGSQLQRLLGLQDRQTQTVAQGLQGQLGTQNSAFNGGMQAAGTIGQGNIAAANAQAAGSQNLLNAGLKLGGMVLGGVGGGGLGASGSSFLGSLMSPSGSNPFNSDGSRNTMAYGS